MKYIAGLAKQNTPKWTGKKWYHQRFDGSPYFLHLIAEAEILDEPRKKWNHNLVHYCFFDHGKADWYIEMHDIERISQKVISLGKKNPAIGKDFIKNWEKDHNRFYAMCDSVGKTKISELTDTEIISLHDQFLEIALKRNSSSSIIDGFALGTDELVAVEIQKRFDTSELKKKVKFSE